MEKMEYNIPFSSFRWREFSLGMELMGGIVKGRREGFRLMFNLAFWALEMIILGDEMKMRLFGIFRVFRYRDVF